MKRNSKLSLALHALGHMAEDPNRKLRSEEIAVFGNTNPVVVRRVLGVLKKAGLLHSEKGHAGGWSFQRLPTDISIADVYVALADAQFARPDQDGVTCAVEQRLMGAYTDAARAAEDVLINRLKTVTVADLAADMKLRPNSDQIG